MVVAAHSIHELSLFYGLVDYGLVDLDDLVISTNVLVFRTNVR